MPRVDLYAFRVALISGLGVAFGAAACGPMPGLVTEPPPRPESSRTVQDKDDQPDARDRAQQTQAIDRKDEPRRAGAAEPASDDDIMVIQLSGADAYYLLDRRRGLCFMHHRDTTTGVDCNRIPEAKGFIDGTPDPEATPGESSVEYERSRYQGDDGVVRRTAPESDTPPVKPGPGSSVTVTPLPAPDPRRSAQPTPAPAPKEAPEITVPSPQELTRFETAYFAIFCDRRTGGEVAPKTRIEAEGLSIERYTEIEGWWASDQEAWWQLTNKARRACK
ncbi:MAG: hypothetical protein ACI9MR_003390 [Myxococcota bacterium]|jgi:hypothetical protein